MLGKLFKSPRNDRTSNGERLYAIGDIHGCLELLEELLAAIEQDAQGRAKQLIFLGDYVDRGPDSKGVVEKLLAIQEDTQNTIFLKGNHEAVMLDFLVEPEDTFHWLDWGGAETLESYGVSNIAGRSGGDLCAELLELLPQTHLTFLKSLALKHMDGDFVFVHAGIRPGIAFDEQKEEDLLWIRKRFHKAKEAERPDKVIVHGHTPIKKPLDAGWRIAIDTGACWNGKLTAVVIDDNERRFISTP